MSQQQDQRIQALKQAIHELESSLPAHSTPPSMLIRLEELEDELARLQKQIDPDRSES
jgi:hypothetical protein